MSQEEIYRGKSSEALSSVVYDVACVAKVRSARRMKCLSHATHLQRARAAETTLRYLWQRHDLKGRTA